MNHKRSWLFAIACSTSLWVSYSQAQERPVRNRPTYTPPTIADLANQPVGKMPIGRMRPSVGAPVLESVPDSKPASSLEQVDVDVFENYNDEGQATVRGVGYQDDAKKAAPEPVPDPAGAHVVDDPWQDINPPMHQEPAYFSPYHAAACDSHGCDGCDACGCDSPCDAMGCGGPCYSDRLGLGIGSLLFSPCNYYSVDYLLWWRRGQTFVPLATSGPANATPATAGVLPGATVVFGGTRVGDGSTSGLRIEAGRWLDRRHYRAVNFRVWGVGKQNIGFFDDGTNFRILSRPFFNVTDGQNAAEAAQRIVFPNQNAGSLSIAGTSEVFGGDVTIRRLALAGMGGRIDWIWGYQQMRINEDLIINSSTTTLPGLDPTIEVLDSFDVKNTFHGAVIGMQGFYREGPLSLEALLKVGLGNINRDVSIFGQTTTRTLPNNVAVANQGLLARATNSGNFSSDEFAASPEVQLALGYQLSRTLDFNFGYSFVSVGNAFQPSRVIDRVVNLAPAPIQGQQRPAPNFETRDYWVQGIHFGLNWNW